MENRFGFKDLLVVVLLVAIVVMIGLKMKQDDRQWDRFGAMQKSLDGITRDMASLQRDLHSGSIHIGPRGNGNGSTTAESPAADVFARLREVQKKPDYARGDWMVESFGSVIPTLNPLMSQDLYATIVQAKVLESLATNDYGTLEMVPLLARSWQVAEDGLSLTVQLRDGVKFSDGEPFSADDVVYTYELTMDPDVTDGRQREWYKIITRVEKLGPLEVKFHFEKPFFESVDRALGMQMYPKHVYEKYSKRELRENTALMIGTGPYRLRDYTKYTPGEQIELVRNDRYWGEPGPWDRIIWRIIENETTDLISFKNGETDALQPLPDQHVEMLKDEALKARKNYWVFDSVRIGYQYVAWNQQRKGTPTPFADPKVRQAMTMLIDRERMRDEIYMGMGTVAHGPFHHLGKQFDHDAKRWKYDPERAISQLESLGFKKSGNRMLKPDGSPFTFKLTYSAGSDFAKKMALFVHDNLAKAGIDAQLDPQKWALMLESLDQKDFDAIMLGWSSSLETDPEQAFHSRTIKEGDNRNSYSNPELDALIDKAHVTLDKDERMAIWRRCDAIINEDQPYTFLMRSMARVWFDKRITGIEPNPVLGINSVSIWPNPVEWYVPKADQLRGN